MKKIFLFEQPRTDYEVYIAAQFEKALAVPPILPGSMTDAARVRAFYVPKVVELLQTIVCETEGLPLLESLKFYAKNPFYSSLLREKAQYVLDRWNEKIPGLSEKVAGESVVEYLVSK